MIPLSGIVADPEILNGGVSTCMGWSELVCMPKADIYLSAVFTTVVL